MLAKIAALVLLAAAPYLFTLDYAFVYDDHGAIVENPFLREPGSLVQVLSLNTMRDPSVVDGQRPVLLLSCLADAALWGLNPRGWHATNVILHAASVLVGFFLFRRLTGRDSTAWAVMALYACHPLLIEAVQVPSFREDLLMGLLGFAALLAGTTTGRGQKAGTILFPLLLAAALLSKESAVAVVPLLVVIYLLVPPVRPGRPVWLLRLGLGLAVTLAGVAMIASGRPLQAVGGAWNGRSLLWPDQVWTAPWLFASYIGKMILPWPLSVDYVVDPVSFGSLRFMIGMAVAVAVLVIVIRGWRSCPLVSLGLAWMVIVFVPVSNLVPLLNPFADRYAYGMLPGGCLLVADVCTRRGRAGHAVLAMLCCLYLALTAFRLPDWKNDEILWRATLATTPQSARAHTWVGLVEKHAGHMKVAEARFREAMRLNPHDPSAAVNLAVLVGQGGDLPQAEQLLRDVLERFPENQPARQNLEVVEELKSR